MEITHINFALLAEISKFHVHDLQLQREVFATRYTMIGSTRNMIKYQPSRTCLTTPYTLINSHIVIMFRVRGHECTSYSAIFITCSLTRCTHVPSPTITVYRVRGHENRPACFSTRFLLASSHTIIVNRVRGHGVSSV